MPPKSTGVRLKRPSGVLWQPVKIDGWGLFKTIAQAAIALKTTSYEKVVESALKLVDVVGFETRPGELAWRLVYRASFRAILSLVNDPDSKLSDEQKTKAVLHVSGLDEQLAESDLAIDAGFFKQPGWSRYAQVVCKQVQSWLRKAGVEPAVAEEIGWRFPRYFTSALSREWLKNATSLAILQPIRLQTPFTPAEEAELAWVDYAAWLSSQADRRLFEEDFGLQAVYVKSRAYIDEQQGNKTTRIVQLAEDFLNHWLETASCGDALRVIEGDPGAGKSSLARTYAATCFGRAIGGRRWRTILAPLHHAAFEKFDLGLRQN